jgi:hypothetical protein
MPDIAEKLRIELALEDDYSLDRPLEQVDVAEIAADDYFCNQWGWDVVWPQQIVLYATQDGPEIGRLMVDISMEPKFSATIMED